MIVRLFGLWKKKSKAGNIYYSGPKVADGVFLRAFKVNSENENAPDLQVCLSVPDDDSYTARKKRAGSPPDDDDELEPTKGGRRKDTEDEDEEEERPRKKKGDDDDEAPF